MGYPLFKPPCSAVCINAVYNLEDTDYLKYILYNECGSK